MTHPLVLHSLNDATHGNHDASRTPRSGPRPPRTPGTPPEPRLTTRHPAWPAARPATVSGSRFLVGTPRRRAVRSGGQTGYVADPRSAAAVVRSRPALPLRRPGAACSISNAAASSGRTVGAAALSPPIRGDARAAACASQSPPAASTVAPGSTTPGRSRSQARRSAPPCAPPCHPSTRSRSDPTVGQSGRPAAAELPTTLRWQLSDTRAPPSASPSLRYGQTAPRCASRLQAAPPATHAAMYTAARS